MKRAKEIVKFVKTIYPEMNPVLLHCPQFIGKEKHYLSECIETNYVSYVGRFVAEFERRICEITGAGFAVALVNGTEALHMALLATGLQRGEEVITQSLTFAATAAAIVHSGGAPIFVDVERRTMGMCPESLRRFLEQNAVGRGIGCKNRITGKRIGAVVPMHTFGHPCLIDSIQTICSDWGIPLIEDAAESLGSYFRGRHTGRHGRISILSFNGNKIVTTGGGGMIITDDQEMAERIRYLSTTAKQPHRWEFIHDEVGYNLRLPSLNAAIGVAQLEYIDQILENKRITADLYRNFFSSLDMDFVTEPRNCLSNYWLNAIVLNSQGERDALLAYTNDNGVQTRPVWRPLHLLQAYCRFQRSPTPVAEFLGERLINIPSSYRL